MIPMRREKKHGARFEQWELMVNLPKVHFWHNLSKTRRQLQRDALGMELTS